MRFWNLDGATIKTPQGRVVATALPLATPAEMRLLGAFPSVIPFFRRLPSIVEDPEALPSAVHIRRMQAAEEFVGRQQIANWYIEDAEGDARILFAGARHLFRVRTDTPEALVRAKWMLALPVALRRFRIVAPAIQTKHYPTAKRLAQNTPRLLSKFPQEPLDINC